MATDATGTPTSRGIPKYNTTNDAPSGKGFNAAMDAIDALLPTVRGRKNSTGSTFERKRFNFIEGTNVTLTVADDSVDDEVDITINASSAAPTYQTTMPGSPVNGQETILVDSTSAPTYAWRFRYNSTLALWEYIGGRAAMVTVDTAESTSSTTYAALATAGPSFAIPVAGTYDISIGARLTEPSAVGMFMSYDIGGTGAVDADAVTMAHNFTNGEAHHFRTKRKSGLTAVTLTAKYRTATAVSATFAHRVMIVTPVTV